MAQVIRESTRYFSRGSEFNSTVAQNHLCDLVPSSGTLVYMQIEHSTLNKS